MELKFVRIDVTPSVTVTFAAIVLYTVWFLFFARRARRTAALMTLTLPPLPLASFAVWVGYANVVGGLSRAGGGRIASAAGIAAALSAMRFGAALTAVLTIVAIIVAARPKDAIGPYPRGPVVIATLCWTLTTAVVFMPSAIRPSFAIWNVCLFMAFVSLALLIPLAVVAMLGHRRTVSRRKQLLALGITLAIALLQIAASSWLVARYHHIAIG